MSPLLGTGLSYGLHTRRKGHNPPRGPSAGWWVLSTANAAEINSLTSEARRCSKYPSNGWPMLLNIRDRTPKHNNTCIIQINITCHACNVSRGWVMVKCRCFGGTLRCLCYPFGSVSVMYEYKLKGNVSLIAICNWLPSVSKIVAEGRHCEFSLSFYVHTHALFPKWWSQILSGKTKNKPLLFFHRCRKRRLKV
jgi:hypothetical protein